MATLAIHDRTGAEVGNYEIDPAQIGSRISKQLLHDAVVIYQNYSRSGHRVRTKNRTDVAGTTKKMYRQKGTGNARAGSRRSGIRRGGGHIHAIRPRDWSYRLTKKALQLATRMALASRIADNEVTLIDQLAFAQPKTREDTGGHPQGPEARRSRLGAGRALPGYGLPMFTRACATWHGRFRAAGELRAQRTECVLRAPPLVAHDFGPGCNSLQSCRKRREAG